MIICDNYYPDFFFHAVVLCDYNANGILINLCTVFCRLVEHFYMLFGIPLLQLSKQYRVVDFEMFRQYNNLYENAGGKVYDVT